jgi:dihydroorotate dehydrogenase electron transfer subunit
MGPRSRRLKMPMPETALGDYIAPPFGRRQLEVTGNTASGGYRLVEAFDPSGVVPVAGQFYMLSTDDEWPGPSGRPYLPRAFSVASTAVSSDGVTLGFLVHAVGPGTARIEELGREKAGSLLALGPLGRGFSTPDEVTAGAKGAILVGGGIGVAPLALLRRNLVRLGIPSRVLLGYRDADSSGGMDLFDCSEIKLATDDGHAGHRGRVTDLLEKLLAGDDRGSAVVYSCGPPAMLEAVRVMCDGAGVACQLALESPMGCGYGACFGCAVPLREGGYMRLCLDGPVVDGSTIARADAGAEAE